MPSQSDKEEAEESSNTNDAFYREMEQLLCCMADGVVCLAEHNKYML